MEKKYWKSQGKVREFCHPGKVGTLIRYVYWSASTQEYVFCGILRVRRKGKGRLS